jgi:hypothetical protein
MSLEIWSNCDWQGKLKYVQNIGAPRIFSLGGAGRGVWRGHADPQEAMYNLC